MKKLATICLILLATLVVGCSANKANVAKALDAGADPTAVTQSPAAGAVGYIAQADQPYACQAMRSHNSEMFCSK